MGLLARDFMAIRAKQAELLAGVKSRHPDLADAPVEVLVQLFRNEEDKFYQALTLALERHSA